MADWLNRLLGGGSTPSEEPKADEGSPVPDQALLVHVPLSNDEFGSDEEREGLFEVEDQMVEAIEGAEIGEYDGNEFGGGEFVMYIYGPDADALFSAAEPILRALQPPMGGFYAMKRYGRADDFGAREERIDLR